MPGSILSDIGDMIRTYSNKLGESLLIMIRFTLILKHRNYSGIHNTKHTAYRFRKKTLIFCRESHYINAKHSFLTDFLRGDVYYNITHPIHNLNRAKNQFILYDSMK